MTTNMFNPDPMAYYDKVKQFCVVCELPADSQQTGKTPLTRYMERGNYCIKCTSPKESLHELNHFGTIKRIDLEVLESPIYNKTE